jgi:ankyrin repeat protein
MNPPPRDSDLSITQFKPVEGQWKLNEKNIKRIDPKTGQTILHNYCKYINSTPLAVYRYLIETNGCDVNVQDKYKDTPLHDALWDFNPNKGGDITVLTYLLTQKDVNVNIKDKDGNTLLHQACEKVNIFPLEIFKLLIETKGADVNAQGNNKNTPLHHALYSFEQDHGGDIAVLTYLLSQKGFDANIKCENGFTLLHWACSYINHYSLDVFKLLIENLGCDVNARDENNDTPLHYALFHFDATAGGDIKVLTYLLNQKDANVNIKGENGFTLLHWACRHINYLPPEIFKLLIETKGADVNAQGNNKNTPLHNAVRCFNQDQGGDITVLTYLLAQKDVNCNVKGKKGRNLLHLACICEISGSYDHNDDSDGDDEDDGDDDYDEDDDYDSDDDDDSDYDGDYDGDDEDDGDDSSYDFTGSNCFKDSEYSAAIADTTLYQVLEVFAERCLQQVLDETTL